HQGRQALPAAGPFQRIDEELQPAIDIAGGDLVRGGREAREQRRGAALEVRIERGIELAAGLGENQPAEQIRPALREAEANMSAAGVAEQIDRTHIELLDEGDEV